MSLYIVCHLFAHPLLQFRHASDSEGLTVSSAQSRIDQVELIYLSCADGHIANQSHMPARAFYGLYSRVSLDISVDMFHHLCPSLSDNQLVLFDKYLSSVMVLRTTTLTHNTVCTMIKSVYYSLGQFLHLFFASDFTMFLQLLYRNLVIYGIFIHHVPQEDPRSTVWLAFLLIKRNTVLRHDFIACLAAFSAKRLTLWKNVQCCLRSAGCQLGQIEVLYSLRHSLPGHFSLPWLFIWIQFTYILTVYRHPASISNQYNASSAASCLFSGDFQHPHRERVLMYGGGREHEFSALDVEPYITAGHTGNPSNNNAFKFVDHIQVDGKAAYPIALNYIHTNIPLSDLIHHLSIRVALKISRLHQLQIGSHVPKSEICRIFEGHNCTNYCNQCVTVFAIVDSKHTRHRMHKAEKKSGNRVTSAVITKPKVSNLNLKPQSEKKLDNREGPSHRDLEFSKLPDTTPFPPAPINNELSQKIINDFCLDSLPSVMEEAGCAVCGQLVPVSQLTRLKGVKNLLHVLHATAVTRFERSDARQSIQEYKGPVLDHA